ncbi:transcription factor WRKY19-like [Zingiber officinale]|uniref:transcription factor WRKY19-like n=1 Tax=Zingiber officinale TaxID=94328 RepID=UPI001C4D4D8D|nr:transcription factor WRKY19-like [Zingiber officinale]
MEASSGGGNWDLDSLVEVLTQGEEHLAQLDACLAAEPEKQLLLRAQSCVRQAIRMAKGRLAAPEQAAALREQDRREMCKKRKTISKKWTRRVHVSYLGTHKDDYSWRKYGQKMILGAKHPRAYFRCTHKSTAGCQAMKQVQRSNDDPSVFEIIYRGEHTCVESSSTTTSRHRPDQDQSLLLSFQSLKVETDRVGSNMEEERERGSSAFVSTPASVFSPPYVSPSATHAAGTASELAEVVAAAAALTNEYDSYAVDLNLLLDSGGFEPNFPFDL